MDPIRDLLGRWEVERAAFARSGSSALIELSRTHSRELQDVMNTLSDARVPYADVEVLTGYALGSLKNTLPNVGTRGAPAFRLGDLPFKAGRASPGKIVTASTILRAVEGRGC